MSTNTIADNAITFYNGNFGIGVTNPTSDTFFLPNSTEIKGSVICDSVALSGAFTKLTTGTQGEFKSWVQSITDDAKENWWSKAAVPRYLESTFTGTTLDGSNTNALAKYAGGVLIPDGRVVFVPINSKVLGIYNPSSNTFTETTYTGTTLDGSNTNTDKYNGGVLIPDGRVVFVPRNSNKLGIYTPSSNTFAETTYTGTTLDGSYTNTVVKYHGGVLIPDGRVVFVPQNSNKLGIYNPSSNTFTETTYTGTTLDGSNTNTNKYSGGVLLPDGRVVFVPMTSNKLGIYNPSSDTFTETTYTATTLDGSNTNTLKYQGGVLIPDGRVVFVPRGSNKLGIYTPSSNTFAETTYTGTALDGVNTTNIDKSIGGVLLPDGRVVFVPLIFNKLVIYNPTTDTYTETTYVGTQLNNTGSNYKYHGGVLLPDGRVVFVPSISNKLGIVSGFPPVPIDRCLHPCFNKF